MPQLANITVKKNDGVTDVTYTGVVPSAGDKSPAVWRNQTVGSAAAHQPEFRLSSRNNGTGTARRVDGQGTYPSLVTGSDGRVSVSDRVVLNISVVVPQGMPTVDANEGVSQLLHLMAATLTKDSVKSGYAPT